MLYIYALHFSLCKFRSSMWHVRQILVFLFHPKPTGPEVLNWKTSSRWYSRPIRSIDEPRIWAATFHAVHHMWSRLKSWLGQWGILRRDRFYLYIPYFRGAGLINNPLHQSNSIKEPDVIFFFAAGFYWSLVKGECWLLSSLRPYFFVFMLRPNKGLVFIPLFGRFSACFFFNGMVWNMLKLPPTLWLEDFLLKFVIVVLASRVQVTPMVFADVSILWCLHACPSTCWVSTQKCLRLSKFPVSLQQWCWACRGRIGFSGKHDHVTMSWNATNIHKPGPGFKLSCSFHLPKTLGRFPIWMAQSDSTHVLVTFVRGFVFLRVGSWKKHLWQTWPLFKVWRDKWIWCSGSYRVTYSKRKSWCSNPFGLSQSYVAPKGWFLLVVLQQEMVVSGGFFNFEVGSISGCRTKQTASNYRIPSNMSLWTLRNMDGEISGF